MIVIKGEGKGPTQAELEALIASTRVADRVRIMPPVPFSEYLEWTASADIGLIVHSPDYSLNVRTLLPNKLFEYLMVGVPVLSSPLEAVAEILGTYDVGQVIAPSAMTPAGIGAAINTMLADDKALSHMRRNALYAAKEFCWDKEKLHLIDLYQDILRRDEKMNTLAQVNASEPKDTSKVQSSIKVCMHRLGGACTDILAMHPATALVAAGYTVSMLDIETKRTCPSEEMVQGVRIHHIIEPAWYTSRRFEPWFFIKVVQTFIRCVLQLLRIPADMYHASDFTALPACALAALLRRKPLIFMIYDLPFPVPETRVVFWRRLGEIFTYLLAVILPHCAGVLATSPLHIREMRKRFDLSETAVSLIRNVPAYKIATKSNHLRKYLGFGPDVRIALYQGNIQPDGCMKKL